MLKNIRKAQIKRKIFKEIILVAIVLYISLLGFSLLENIYNFDTMWTFLFSKKIADGYITYGDYNMIQTPLFAQISGIILKIFGGNILVFQMIGVIYAVLIGVMIYLILKKVKIPFKIRTFILLIEYIYIYKIMANSYNVLSLLFVLIVIYIEINKFRYEKYMRIKGEKEDKKTIFIYNIFSGIVLGLTFLAKQNIGVLIVLAVTFSYFLRAIYLKEKNFTNIFKELTIKAIFCISIILIEIIYFALNGALYNFIDYAFLGLSSFNEEIGSSLIKTIVKRNKIFEFSINCLIISMLIFIPIYSYGKKINLVKRKNNIDNFVLIFLFFLLLIGFGFSIPLANDYHLYLTKVIGILVLCIILFSINIIRVFINNIISKYILVLMIIVPVLIGILNIYIYFNYAQKSKLEVFKGAYLQENSQNSIMLTYIHILSYEKENNMPLYVITGDSAIYSLILGRNQGVFDLPLKGNLGHKDYIKIINELKSIKKNHSVMIYTDDNSAFWQESQEVRKYIKDNYWFVEEYQNYSIYEYFVD